MAGEWKYHEKWQRRYFDYHDPATNKYYRQYENAETPVEINQPAIAPSFQSTPRTPDPTSHLSTQAASIGQRNSASPHGIPALAPAPGAGRDEMARPHNVEETPTSQPEAYSLNIGTGARQSGSGANARRDQRYHTQRDPGHGEKGETTNRSSTTKKASWNQPPSRQRKGSRSSHSEPRGLSVDTLSQGVRKLAIEQGEQEPEANVRIDRIQDAHSLQTSENDPGRRDSGYFPMHGKSPAKHSQLPMSPSSQLVTSPTASLYNRCQNVPGEGVVGQHHLGGYESGLPNIDETGGDISNPERQLNPARERPGDKSWIRGNTEEREGLDERYKVRDSRFFTKGRVFALLWHDTVGTAGTQLSGPGFVQSRFQEHVYSTIRRMVVVKEGKGFCWCLPVNTYQGKGTTKKGLNASSHAIIYMSNSTPQRQPTETDMNKEPISVDPAQGQRLDPMSRINFEKVYTVEHNVKVMNVGRVADSSMPKLKGYWAAHNTD